MDYFVGKLNALVMQQAMKIFGCKRGETIAVGEQKVAGRPSNYKILFIQKPYLVYHISNNKAAFLTHQSLPLHPTLK